MRWRNGYYVPNPTMRLRVPGADGQEEWQPVHAAMALRRVLAGNGYGAARTALESLLPKSEREAAAATAEKTASWLAAR